MNNQKKYDAYRKKYKEFYYHSYTVDISENKVNIKFLFEIKSLATFTPSWQFPILQPLTEEQKKALDILAFHLGMVELISYWKITCPPVVKIEAGTLSDFQLQWWKKLYYNGLGEFYYTNQILPEYDHFMNIECKNIQKDRLELLDKYQGCLVPIGGGKDSVVTLNLLHKEEVTTFSINRTLAIENIVKQCDDKKSDVLVQRTLDPTMLQLNKQGYLNGHTPFSAIVAFSSYITAILYHQKYIVLSNESSANESTVKNSYVNHQYSKSYEFEKDFQEYMMTVVKSPILYFSLLRPITEIQIAKLFSLYKEYHSIFRSCNVGSKKDIWCCNCPKCLFVYIILSPFLDQKDLENIFGENLLDKSSLEMDFRKLIGLEEEKPFECVGTRREVLAALKYILSNKNSCAYLVKKYKKYIEENEENLSSLLQECSSEHNVPTDFSYILEELRHL